MALVLPEWRQVQMASFAENAVGLERAREGSRRGSIRRLLPGLNGYLSSFGALVATLGAGETLAALPPYLRDYEVMSGVTFAERLAAKRRVLGLS